MFAVHKSTWNARVAELGCCWAGMLLDQNRRYLISDILCISNLCCVVKITAVYFSCSFHSTTRLFSPLTSVLYEDCFLWVRIHMSSSFHFLWEGSRAGGAVGLIWLMGSWLEAQPLPWSSNLHISPSPFLVVCIEGETLIKMALPDFWVPHYLAATGRLRIFQVFLPAAHTEANWNSLLPILLVVSFLLQLYI